MNQADSPDQIGFVPAVDSQFLCSESETMLVCCGWLDSSQNPYFANKIAANLEGPFEIAEVVGNGAYRLREIHGGKPIHKT